MKGKSLWGALILNLLFPGLGYLYVGRKRQLFSVGLLAGTVISYFSPALWKSDVDAPLMIGGLILALVFAVDAYQDAKETKLSGESNVD